MSLDHIQTTADYAEYEARVDEFFNEEKIENLSAGHICCPDCGDVTDREHCSAFLENGTCPDCGEGKECMDEPYFAWWPCECCSRSLGGNRYHATGYNRDADTIQEYQICTDCMYYAEYGQLDDMAMMEIKESEVIA